MRLNGGFLWSIRKHEVGMDAVERGVIVIWIRIRMSPESGIKRARARVRGEWESNAIVQTEQSAKAKAGEHASQCKGRLV
jgi:hypothetical protein